MANIGFGGLSLLLLFWGVPLALGVGLVIWVVRALLRMQNDIAAIRKSLDRLTSGRTGA